MQPAGERAAIEAMGRVLGPDMLAAVYALYGPEQVRLGAGQPAAVSDCTYGEHPRQRLDLYAPSESGAPAPVLLWVHGGGFLRGEKHSPDHPFNAHVGRWAARHGMVGAVMNYRLAPDSNWPSGGEDVGSAVDWLRTNCVAYGGDPSRIFAVGTSAGAVHVATHLMLRPDDPGVAGAVLMSGLYGFTPLDDRDTLYYGAAEDYPARMPRDAVIGTTLPLLLASAEFDPPRFQAEFAGLLQARLERHGALPRSTIVSGHNHFSLPCHIGTTDTRLADEILSFIGAPS